MQGAGGIEYGSRYNLMMELFAEARSPKARDGRVSERVFRSHVLNSDKSCLECYRKDGELLRRDLSYVVGLLSARNLAGTDASNPDIIVVYAGRAEIKL
jgi:hypothetical protein